MVTNSAHSVLIFCGTKKDTQEQALHLRSLMPESVRQFKKEEKELILQRLKYVSTGEVDPVLQKTIPFGIAYHNSSNQN